MVCDRTGRTSAEDVWAVGDVARTPHPHGAGTVRLEHWTSAADGAALVAANLLAAPGEAREATETPYFWSDQYDRKIQCLGLPVRTTTSRWPPVYRTRTGSSASTRARAG